MSRLKGFVLGTAATLAMSAAAHAADLPVKAKAVEYVKVCSLYGAGFWYIPGTDTCMKLGGYIRSDVSFNASGPYEGPAWNGAAGQNNRNRNAFIYRSRQDLNIDTRTATEYGVVRTYFDGVFQWTTGSDLFAGGSLGVYYAFIQFAGFTIGKAQSQFSTPWLAYPGNNTAYLLGGESNDTGINQIAYTAQFGNGVSAAISLEDPIAYRQSALYNTSGVSLATYPTSIYGTNSYGGAAAPDVVGQIRVDQAWGLIQLSGAAHNVHANYYIPTLETSGHPTDKWGYAAQIGISLKNLPTGPGDTINFNAGYAYGATRYLFSHQAPGNLNAPGGFAMYGSPSNAGSYQSIAFGGLADGVFSGTSSANGSQISLSSAFGVRGAFTHNWDAYWNTSLFGSYSTMRWGSSGRAAICNATVLAAYTPGSTCSPNYNISQFGAVTRWTPVKNLTFSGEVYYTYLDQNNQGSIALPAIATKPAAVYSFKDLGTITYGLRAQRTF